MKTPENDSRTSPPAGRQELESDLLEAAKEASRLLEPRSLGVLCRKPLVDEDVPEVSDVDLIAFWERPEESPERITVDGPLGRVFVDVLWIPISAMLDPLEAASYKTLPHLLLESETVWMRSDAVTPLIDNVRSSAYLKPVWERRLGNQVNFGDAALEEARKNLDCPPAALFFLQTAHSYYTTALADHLRQSTMSILTRPATRLRRISAETGLDFEGLLKTNLHLDADPSPSVAALARVYDAVKDRCATRQPRGVSVRTRGHYLYSLSPLEFEYRTAVAEALIGKGDLANANCYLRFWAYSLSRCPVVLEDAREGRNPSFYVPRRGFKEAVRAVCPEILDDMQTIMGGEGAVTVRDAEASIDGTTGFRRLVTAQMRGVAGLAPAVVEAGASLPGP